MPFVGGLNVAQVELRATWRNIPVENVLYFKTSGGDTLTESGMSDLAEFIGAWWAAGMKTRQSIEYTLREIYVTDLTTDTSPTFSRTTNLPSSGLDPATSVASNQALTVSFRTAQRGRSARGRNYVPGLRASQLVGNNWIVAEVNAVVAIYAQLLDINETVPFRWGVLSRRTNGADRADGLFLPITSVLAVTTQVTSQDGRLN